MGGGNARCRFTPSQMLALHASRRSSLRTCCRKHWLHGHVHKSLDYVIGDTASSVIREDTRRVAVSAKIRILILGSRSRLGWNWLKTQNLMMRISLLQICIVVTPISSSIARARFLLALLPPRPTWRARRRASDGLTTRFRWRFSSRPRIRLAPLRSFETKKSDARSLSE